MEVPMNLKVKSWMFLYDICFYINIQAMMKLMLLRIYWYQQYEHYFPSLPADLVEKFEDISENKLLYLCYQGVHIASSLRLAY